MPAKSTTKKPATKKQATKPRAVTQKVKEPEAPVLVGIRRKQTVPGLVRLPNGNVYHFSVKNNICLGYVDEADVNAILAYRKNCCNNSGGSLFKLASDGEIRVYNEGGRI